MSSAIDWAARRLSEKENLWDAVLHLGNSAFDLINLGLIREHARLAFVGAGFADIEEGSMRKLMGFETMPSPVSVIIPTQYSIPHQKRI
jgi:hypothetical protein